MTRRKKEGLNFSSSKNTLLPMFSLHAAALLLEIEKVYDITKRIFTYGEQ